MMSAFRQKLLYSSGLAALVFLLHGGQLSGFWRGDDTQILLHALRYSWWEYFFDSKIWQSLSPANLTPWVSLSFDFDLALFGLNPAGFYGHQLLVLAAVVVAGLYLAALWLKPYQAFISGGIFLFGMPVESVVSQLMARHYLEGLLFSLLAVYFFIRFLREEKRYQLLITTLAYVLAMTAKEIYVPLGLLLLCLHWQHRGLSMLSRVVPLLLVMAAYVVWRSLMLDTLVSGYSEPSYFSVSYWQAVWHSFTQFPRILFGRYAGLVMGVYGVVLSLYFFYHRRHLILAGVLSSLVLLPLVPLVQFPGISAPDRYLLLPWTVWCFSFTWFLFRIPSTTHIGMQGVQVSALIIVLAVVVHNQVQFTDSLHQRTTTSDVQMRFAWTQDDRVAFIPTRIISGALWGLNGLVEIKQQFDGGRLSPTAVVDLIFLKEEKSLFEYDPNCGCMRDVSAAQADKIAEFKQQQRPDAPLSLFMRNRQGLIDWQFTPYTDGQYRVVSPRIGSYRMSQQGRLRSSIKQSSRFYLLYISEEGWRTYSPELILTADGEILDWTR